MPLNFLTLILLGGLLGWGGLASAGAAYDGTMGTSGSLSGKFTVRQAAGTTKGNNLFHSFSSFNINSGESATFTGASTIQNVIARVTGGGSSTINGLLDSKTSMPSANFFLLNPAGVIFGSGASLNIGGAFHASTADYLLFGTTSEKFYSSKVNTSVLSTAAPTAFGFLTVPSKGISTSGSSLTVGTGKQLTLSGGGLTVSSSSTLSAPGGRIDLVSVASKGEFDFSTATPTSSSIATLGNVTVSGSSLIDTTSTAAGTIYIRGGVFVMDKSTLKANKTGAGSAGGIDINATSSVTLDNNSTLALQSESGASGSGNNLTLISPFITFRNGSKITTTSFGAGNGGAATLTSTHLVDFDNSNIFLQTQGSGNAAALTINAENIRLSNGSKISSSTSNSGNGGSVTMTASQAILLDGEKEITSNGKLTTVPTSIFLQSLTGSGNAGTLTLTANQMALRDGAAISTTTSGTGNGGNASLTLTKSLELSGSGGISGNASRIYTATANAMAGGGTGGNLTINTGTLTMDNGGGVVSEATGTGNAGSITIVATGAVTMKGTNGAGQATGISAASKPLSAVLTGAAKTAGLAGNISFTAPSLTMSNGAFISGSSIASAGFSSSNAGKLNLTISGTTSIDGVNPFGENSDGFGSGLYARSALAGGVSAGSAGVITLNSGALVLTGGGIITSSTDNSAAGGSIAINGGGVNISGSGSALFGAASSQSAFGTGATSSTSGLFVSSSASGAGGNIDLTLTQLTMNGGKITSASSSTAASAGNAGAIKIQAGTAITLRNHALISTESINGGGGGMTVNAIDRLDMRDSQITTSVQGGLGNGGDIHIDPRFIIMNNSNIIANAFGGNGGNINIIAGNFLQSSNSIVSASSQLGIAGNIKIDSPEIEVDAGLIHLPSSFLDASQWIRSPCRVHTAGSQSSFIVAQRDGVPLQLDEWLPGSYATTAAASPHQQLAFASLLPLCTQ